MAVATPATLPVPTVAARAVVRAWNWERECLSDLSCTFLSLKMETMVESHHSFSRVICKKPVRRVSHMPHPTSSSSMTGPHTNPCTALTIWVSRVMKSIEMIPAFLVLFAHESHRRWRSGWSACLLSQQPHYFL